MYHWYTLVSLFRASLWDYLLRNVRNLRGSLRAGNLFASQAVDDLICPPLPLWLYQTDQGGIFFFLNKKKKKQFWNSSEWATFHKGGPSSYFGAAGEWNDSSRINYVWPQTEGSEWTRVDRRPVTSRSRWWKIGRVIRKAQPDRSLKGSGVRGYHLPPKNKKKMLPLCGCHWANSMGRVYTRAHTRKHTKHSCTSKKGSEQPRGFQGSAAHPDWESRSTCNISSQWKCSTSTQRGRADICYDLTRLLGLKIQNCQNNWVSLGVSVFIWLH